MNGGLERCKLIEEKKRAAHLPDPVQVNNFEGSPKVFEGSSPYQNIEVEANKQWEDTHGEIIHVLERMEKRLVDLSNPVEEMSANEVSWSANTHTLVSNFDSLDDLCRVDKIVDDDSDDLKQLKVSQPAQYIPDMFDEIPEKVYVVQIPATPLYSPTSVVFHVEPTERALTRILCSELSKNDTEMGYNLHENEYGKFYEKFYVNYERHMS
ncbi:hypothetical protein AgCh_022105 [Apium graveolens]